jgi:hypothetical protein
MLDLLTERFFLYRYCTKCSVLSWYVVGIEHRSYYVRISTELYCCEEPAVWGENSAPTITIFETSNIQHWIQHWIMLILTVPLDLIYPIYRESWNKHTMTRICICICICICIVYISNVDETVAVSLVLNEVVFIKSSVMDCDSGRISFKNIAVTNNPVESPRNIGSLHATLVYYALVITLDVDVVFDAVCWYRCVALVESLTGLFVHVIFNDRCSEH